jgi:hypothetical protein
MKTTRKLKITPDFTEELKNQSTAVMKICDNTEIMTLNYTQISKIIPSWTYTKYQRQMHAGVKAMPEELGMSSLHGKKVDETYFLQKLWHSITGYQA